MLLRPYKGRHWPPFWCGGYCYLEEVKITAFFAIQLIPLVVNSIGLSSKIGRIFFYQSYKASDKFCFGAQNSTLGISSILFFCPASWIFNSFCERFCCEVELYSKISYSMLKCLFNFVPLACLPFLLMGYLTEIFLGVPVSLRLWSLKTEIIHYWCDWKQILSTY